LIKIAITTLLIVVISEVSRRSSFVGALLASIPLVSVLAIFWLYVDTNDSEKISALATSIFWLVIPSLAFFVTLPVLLKNGIGFYPSMGFSMVATVGCYYLMLVVLNHFGVEL
jgi:uncharacterized membrane protein (GlpM family)